MKILNHKMYNKYYPLLTNDDVKRFVDEYGCGNIRRLLAFDEESLMVEESLLIRNFQQQLKPEYGMFGKVKFENVKHNRYLEHQLNENLDMVNAKIDKLESIQNDFFLNDSLSVDAANHILLSLNHDHRITRYCILFLIIALILFLIIYCI